MRSGTLCTTTTHPYLFRTTQTESIWKYSVLNVFSGIELILKHRLRQEHWSLIFEDVNDASESKLEQGDFVSVNHSNVVKRLDRTCNIKVNDLPLNELRKLRNKFEHFEVKIEVSECKEKIASAIREVIVFWDENIFQNSTEEQNQKFNWIKSMAFEFDTYVQNMLQKKNEKITGILKSDSGILVHCQNCFNHSFMIYRDGIRKFECFVCENTIRKESFLQATRNSELEKSKPENSLFIKYEEYNYDCPNCGNKTRVRYEPSYFLSTDEYQPDYFFCVECLYWETQLDINSCELEKELLELAKNHSSEEFHEILENRIKSLEEYLE
ncbi:MAG: hypothetical protein RBJ76_21280 [Stenomitos frigidus ULC029]